MGPTQLHHGSRPSLGLGPPGLRPPLSQASLRPQLQRHTGQCRVPLAPSPASHSRPSPPRARPAHRASTARRLVSRPPPGPAQQVRGGGDLRVQGKGTRRGVRAHEAAVWVSGSIAQPPRPSWQDTLLPRDFSGGTVLLSVPPSWPGYYCDSSAGPVQDFSLYPCPQGYYCPLGTATATHHRCPVGTYGPRRGLRSITECQLCPAGKFCALAGLTAPTGMSWRQKRVRQWVGLRGGSQGRLRGRCFTGKLHGPGSLVKMGAEQQGVGQIFHCLPKTPYIRNTVSPHPSPESQGGWGWTSASSFKSFPGDGAPGWLNEFSA